MIIDIILICILLVSAFLAMRKGMVISLVSMLSWAVCSIGGLLFNEPVKNWINESTEIDENINEVLFLKSSASLKEGDLDAGLLGFPELFDFSTLKEGSVLSKISELFGKTDDYLSFLKKPVDSLAETLSHSVADKITDLLMGIIAFLFIVLVAKIFCGIITLLMSKKYREGAIGFLDGFGGFCFGLVRGGIIILLIFAALVPIIALASPENSNLIIDQLSTSKAAETIYQNNILINYLFL